MDMKRTKKPFVYPVEKGCVMSVREAKAQLSSLIGRAGTGESITITWHGRPRARLVPIDEPRRKFKVDRAWLKSMKVQGAGERSDVMVRNDRDARG